MKTSSKFTLIALVLVALGLAGGTTWFFTGKSPDVSIGDWSGNWEVTYFYKNDQDMPYRGTLHLVTADSLSGSLEVFPPKSIRPELLEIQSLSFSDDHSILKGQLVHNSFKIREGFPKETFELKMKNRNTLKGTGACLEYCAEGTEGIEIVWQGNKTEQK